MVLLSCQWRSYSEQMEKPTINVSKPRFQRPQLAIRDQRSRPTVCANCMASKAFVENFELQEERL